MKYPIVILHGWGLSARIFEPLARELREHGFTVFVPDLPGFGDAIIPKQPLFLTDYVSFLTDYFKEHSISSPIIIGHSFGGRVALKFTQIHPNMVRALILTGTPGFTPIAKKKLLLFITIAKLGKLFFLLPFFRYFQEGVRRWYYFVVGARDYYRAEGVMRDTFKNIVREELVTSMRAVRVPTLLVWGSDDIITPVTIAKKMKDTIKEGLLEVIANQGHGFAYKNPKEFVKVLIPWLTTL